MMNIVKLSGIYGPFFINPDIILCWGNASPKDKEEHPGVNGWIGMNGGTVNIKDSANEIKRKLNKFYERKRRTEERIVNIPSIWTDPKWTVGTTGDGQTIVSKTTVASSSPDTPTNPVESEPDPKYEKESPTSAEPNTSAEPTGTMYTTDPNTPLPPGDKWEKMGGKILRSIYVGPRIQDYQAMDTLLTLYRAVHDPAHPGPQETPSL